MAKNIAVYGIYPNRHLVEEGVDALRAAGFRSGDVSVLFPENEGSKDFAVEKNTKAPEGTTAGATSGAIIGGALGWLVSAGLLVIPGLGPVMAAGPLVATIAGVGAGGVVGGIVGALIGMGVPEYEAKRYEGRIRGGGILLSVHCDDKDWEQDAKDVLLRTGAEDISSHGEAKADFDRTDKPRPRVRPEVRLGETTAERRTEERVREERVRTAGNPDPEV